MTSGFDHYEVDHADWKREKYFEKNSKIFSFLLLFLKDLTSKTIEEYNIYEEATEFLSVKMIKNAVYLEWSLLASYARITQEERWRAIDRGLKAVFKIREQFVEHLADTHPSAHQTLGSRLDIAPTKIKALLIEALNPNLYDVWTKMAKLHSQ